MLSLAGESLSQYWLFFFFWRVCIIFIQEWQKIVSISFQNKDGIAKENASFCLHNFLDKS